MIKFNYPTQMGAGVAKTGITSVKRLMNVLSSIDPQPQWTLPTVCNFLKLFIKKDYSRQVVVDISFAPDKSIMIMRIHSKLEGSAQLCLCFYTSLAPDKSIVKFSVLEGHRGDRAVERTYTDVSTAFHRLTLLTYQWGLQWLTVRPAIIAQKILDLPDDIDATKLYIKLREFGHYILETKAKGG